MLEELGKEADGFMAKSDYESAENVYTAYMEKHGEEYAVLRALGNIQVQSGNLPAACDTYGNAFDIQPDSAEAAVNYGNALFLMHRYTEADAVFSYAAKQHTCPELGIGLANTRFELKKTDEAVTLLTNLQETYPDNPEIPAALVRIYRKLDRIEDANRVLETEIRIRKTLAESSGSAQNWLAYANLMLENGNPETAVSACTRSLSCKATSAAYLCRGTARIRAGNRGAGITDIATAADFEPENLQNLLKTADTCMSLELYEDAIGYYTLAIGIRSVRADTWASCAYALLKAGKRTDAEAFFAMAKASAAVRELKWPDKLHKSETTVYLDTEFGGSQ